MKYVRLRDAVRYDHGVIENPADLYSSPIEAIVRYHGADVLMVAHSLDSYTVQKRNEDICDLCTANGRGIREIDIWGYIVETRSEGSLTFFKTMPIRGKRRKIEDLARMYFGRIAPETGFNVQMIGR